MPDYINITILNFFVFFADRDYGKKQMWPKFGLECYIIYHQNDQIFEKQRAPMSSLFWRSKYNDVSTK